MNLLVLIRLFFGFVLFENGAACESVGLRFRGGLFVLGFREIGGQCGNLVFAQFSFAMSGCRFLLEERLRRFGQFSGLSRGCFGLGASIREEPAGKSAGESAGNAAAARSCGRQTANRAWCWFFHRGLLFVSFVFDAGNGRKRYGRLAAIFCEGFTGENDFVLGSNGSGRRRWARRFGTAIVVTARLAAAIVVTAGFAALRRSIF
jgi:hypothetical protein